MMSDTNKFADYLKKSKYPIFILGSDLKVVAVNRYIEENSGAIKPCDSLSDILKNYQGEYKEIKEKCSNMMPCAVTLTNELKQSVAFITAPIVVENENFTMCYMVFASAGYGLADDYTSFIAEKYRSRLKKILDILAPIGTKLDEHEEYETLDYLNKVAQSCHTMLKYSSSIKEYADASKGLTRLSLSPVCLNSVISSIAGSIGSLIINKDYHLKFVDCEEKLYSSIDMAKFSIVMNNVIANACAFSPQSSTITITLAKRKNNAVISITDEGKGMSTIEMIGAFHPFFSTDSEHASALGMGLTIAKKLVELHGGSIYLDTEQYNGTTVNITLPIDEKIDGKIAMENAYEKYARPYSLNNVTDLHMTFAEICELTLY